MAFTIPTSEPSFVVIGDTVQWTRSLSEFLPADGWTLTYVLINSAGQITIVAEDDGSGSHLVNVDAKDSAEWAAGVYRYVGVVESTAGERHTVATGTIEVKANYADETSGLDARTHVKRTLDLIETAIEQRVTKGITSISVDGVSLQRESMESLIALREKYRTEYAKEIAAEKLSQGLGGIGRIRVRR